MVVVVWEKENGEGEGEDSGAQKQKQLCWSRLRNRVEDTNNCLNLSTQAFNLEPDVRWTLLVRAHLNSEDVM